MQTNSKIFDDFARLASGAVGTAQGMKTEFDNLIHQQLERMMTKMDLVPREEFDAVKAMVVSLTETVEQQAEKIEGLEKKLAAKPRKTGTASKTTKK